VYEGEGIVGGVEELEEREVLLDIDGRVIALSFCLEW
jgi:hypothetical protein